MRRGPEARVRSWLGLATSGFGWSELVRDWVQPTTEKVSTWITLACQFDLRQAASRPLATAPTPDASRVAGPIALVLPDALGLSNAHLRHLRCCVPCMSEMLTACTARPGQLRLPGESFAGPAGPSPPAGFSDV